jgi:hypothetical protein
MQKCLLLICEELDTTAICVTEVMRTVFPSIPKIFAEVSKFRCSIGVKLRRPVTRLISTLRSELPDYVKVNPFGEVRQQSHKSTGVGTRPATTMSSRTLSGEDIVIIGIKSRRIDLGQQSGGMH